MTTHFVFLTLTTVELTTNNGLGMNIINILILDK